MVKLGRLLLERRLGESVLIGQGQELVTVTVHRLGSGRVKLEVVAPVSIPVARGELDMAEKQRRAA